LKNSNKVHTAIPGIFHARVLRGFVARHLLSNAIFFDSIGPL
jgi:hypothetical protein